MITGAGEVFCAGFDLDEFTTPELADELWASSDRWHRTVLEFPLPTVAAVNGAAYGGGFDLAVMCDLRVVADTARFAPSGAHVRPGRVRRRCTTSSAARSPVTSRSTGRRDRRRPRPQRLGLVTPGRPGAPRSSTTRARSRREIATAPRDVLLRDEGEDPCAGRGITPGATLDL